MILSHNNDHEESIELMFPNMELIAFVQLLYLFGIGSKGYFI